MKCECGCGGDTRLAPKTRSAKGHVKGQPIRFIAGHQRRKAARYRLEDRGYQTPCHIWQGAILPNGYGQEWDNDRNRMVAAHRRTYERAHGPIPGHLELDHLCRVRACVNPGHLEAVTHLENMRRGHSWNAGDGGTGGGRGLWSHGSAMGGDRFLAPVIERTWHRLEIAFFASRTNAGSYSVSLDGVIVDRREGVSIIRPDRSYIYIKQGLYRNGPARPGTSEVLVDGAGLIG